MYSAGTAYLTIVPSFKGIERAIREQLAKAGADADKSISGGIGNSTGDAISRQIARGLSGNGARARKAGEDDGKRYAGSLGDTIQKQLAAGHKALPEETSGPHTDQVRLTELRKDLESLKDFHIKGDVDDAQALLDIEGLKARIDELKASTKDIPLKLDLEESSRELEKALGRFNSFAEKGGEDAGNKFGGAFAESWRSHLNDAADSLPTIELDADSTPADMKIAELKARLAELSGKTIGVDFDDAKALAEIRGLLIELDKVARSDPRISARADIAAAYGELLALDGLAKRLDGKKINLKALADSGSATNDINVGISRMGVLIGLGVSLGPAIVPAAAAAAAAIAGIATAAIGAGAGIGVLMLGFSGISGAVQALGKAQKSAEDNSRKLVTTNKGVASSAYAISAAERGLADARTNAAYTAERSAQAIVKAQRDVADAEKQTQKAQEDLTAAEEKARQEDEDRTLSLRENATAQKEALLDIQDSKNALATLLANPRASDEEKQRAKDAYDQRVEQYDGLVIQGKRLQAEQDKSFKAGVAGNTEVKNAQDQVEKSVRAVADAQLSLANTVEDGQRQQHQSAEAIISAQEQLAQAHQSSAAAVSSSSQSATTAMNNLQDAMENLSPSGQQFARFIFGLKDDFKQLRDSAAEGMLPKFQTAITGLLPYLPSVSTFIGKIASTLGDVAIDVVQAFANPAWQRFFGFVDQTAAPTLIGLEKVVENVANGITDLLVSMSPFNRSMGSGLIKLTADFASWSAKLSSTKGFKEFLDYVRDNSGAVIHMLGNLAETIGHIVVAAAPVGAVVVRALSAMSAVINVLPIGLLTVFLTVIATATAVILPLVGALKLYKFGVDLLGGSQKLWNEITAITTKVQAGLASVLTKVQTGMKSTTAASTSAGASLTATGNAASGASKFLGAGGLGLALGVAVLALTYFAGESQKAKQRTDDLKDSLRDFTEVYKDGVTPAANHAAAALASTNSGLQGLLDVTNKAGVSTNDLVNGLNGNAEARRNVVKAIDAQQQAELLAASNARNGSDSDNEASKSHRDRANALGVLHDAFIANTEVTAQALAIQQRLDAEQLSGVTQLKTLDTVLKNASATTEDYGSALDSVASISADAGTKTEIYARIAEEVAQSSLSAADKATLFTKELDAIGQSATTNGSTFESLTNVFDSIARTSLNAHDKVSLLTKALQDMYQPSVDLNEANETLVRTQSDFKTEISKSSGGFALNTKATAENQAAILRNRDALEAALTATRDKYVQDLASGIAEVDARKAHDDSIKSLLNGLPTRGKEADAVNNLVTLYGAIPAQKATDITTPGLEDAIDKLARAHAIDVGLSMNPPWSTDQIDSEYNYLKLKLSGAPSSALRHATGGRITGPGTSTSDSIPALLSNDEHVWTAAEVGAAGGHGKVEALRKAALENRLPRFADGGQVSSKWPILINTSGIRLPDIDALNRKYQAATAKASIAVAIGDVTTAAIIAAEAGKTYKGTSANVINWIGEALKYTDPKRTDASWIYPLEVLISRESGGNPHSINLTDSNAQRGDPSRGLMQTIGGTFEGHRDRRLPDDIYNPVANIVAGINYILGRYGTIFNVQQANPNKPPKGYDSGGWLPPGYSTVFNGTGRPEPVLTAPQLDALVQAANGGGGHVENHYHMEFADTTLTPEKFRAMQDRDAVLARQGRAR